MTGICSRHREYVESCKLCNTRIQLLLPDYDVKVEEAKAAGLHRCERCGFDYYKTTAICPRCSLLQGVNHDDC